MRKEGWTHEHGGEEGSSGEISRKEGDEKVKKPNIRKEEQRKGGRDEMLEIERGDNVKGRRTER